MTNPVVRSTKVPTALPEAVEPMMRSPSQCPGTARSSISGGRSLIITISGIRVRRCPGVRRGLRIERPVRR